MVAGDTVRVRIAAGPFPTAFAIDYTYTVTAGDVAAANKEISVATNMVAGLNAIVNFAALWKASRIRDNAIVYISSKLYAEQGERPNMDDFRVDTTGTITATRAFDKIETKGKGTSLARDPADPRLGTIGVTGSVTSVPSEFGDIYLGSALNAGSASLLVNGSLVTPIDFTVNAIAGKNLWVRGMRFFGGAAGIKYGQFLKTNTPLTNGIAVTVKSNNNMKTLPLIKLTEDFKNRFAFGQGQTYLLEMIAAGDQFVASLVFDIPFPIYYQGAFGAGNDDYIKVSVRDDIRTSASSLEFSVLGFEREP
jgi:hypothetical protein